MSASAILGYALFADTNRDPLMVGLVIALVGAVGAVVTTMMSNASANRRQRIELRSRKGQSGLVGFLFVVIAVLTVGLVVVATRPDDTTVVVAGPAPPSSIASEAPVPTSTTPVPTAAPPSTNSSAAPACAAFTVQVAAVRKDSAAMAEFETQAHLLAQALPELGELHSEAGDACGASSYKQFYFGPFSDGDAALDACLGIGQVLHDNPAIYTQFQNKGAINYPYYRVIDGISVTHPDGTPFVCDPAQSST